MNLETPPLAEKNVAGARPILEVRSLVKEFPVKGASVPWRARPAVRAVRNVSLSLQHGASVGLVGESGSGKTTFGRCVTRLTDPTSGEIYFDGRDLTAASDKEMRLMRRQIQIVFQDPYGSLNPRWTAGRILAERVQISGITDDSAVLTRVRELLRLVRLDEGVARAYPHQLSGGQQQRVGIARALATNPELVVLDEPTSSLDWVTRAAVLRLLGSLHEQLSLTYILISHDLSAVRALCERVAVMYLGEIVEEGPVADIFASPQHPYTVALLSAVSKDRASRSRRLLLQGDPPSPIDVPSGCAFASRCPFATSRCREEPQTLLGGEHSVACWRSREGELPLSVPPPAEVANHATLTDVE